MTTVLHPPQLGPTAPHYPTPPPAAGCPSRVVIGAAVLSLVASLGAVTVAGIGWETAHSGSTQSQTPSATTASDVGQVAAARTKACEMWRTSANMMDDATNAVAKAPKNWNAPETQEALAAEARRSHGGERDTFAITFPLKLRQTFGQQSMTTWLPASIWRTPQRIAKDRRATSQLTRQTRRKAKSPRRAGKTLGELQKWQVCPRPASLATWS